MTSTWLDSSESEYEAYDDSAEDYGDADEEYGEESRADRRRRARIALARRRQAEVRARGRAGQPVRVPTRPVQQTAQAIRNLDLESKVAEDRLRGSVSRQDRRMSRAEYSAMAAVIANQVVQSFDGPDNPYLRAGLLASPLLLLDPQHRRRGVEGWLTDPRLLGFTAVAGITFFGEHRRTSSQVARIDVQSPGSIPAGEDRLVVAVPRDRNGAQVNASVTWDSSDRTRATVDRVDDTTGRIVPAANNPGQVVITATAAGTTTPILITVKPPKGGG